MGKIVKTVASFAIVAVASAIGGPLGGFLATTALSVGSSLLAKKPKAPKNSPEALDRLRASIDPRTPRKCAEGWTAMAADIR